MERKFLRWSLILSAIMVLTYQQVNAQGCSDAGFCTMGAMKPDQSFNKKVKLKLRTIEVSYYHGASTLSPLINVVNLDASFSITNNLGFQIKLPYQWVNGNFDNTSGMGDISLSATQRISGNENYDISATLGMKIPSNDGDLKDSGSKFPEAKGLSLPMYYQTSLGSYDVVAGASYISSKWLFATGIQAALTTNSNNFWPGEWVGIYPDESYVRDYDVATNLKRGTDVMIRVERNFRFSNYSFNIGLLPIYRITKDQIEDRDTGEYMKLDDTTGLALTLLSSFSYHFDVTNSIKVSFGKKFMDRKVNPDGLTRQHVIIVAYGFRF
ncbi:hypothetical protein SAMN04488029_1737 [Reichenbachiella faecimaris]|uniref:MetA-pathway of phenol degradation n=1 Tax=Reichenbachiella faecimaris TaxID=692418 RepID=A0A1W2GCA3_REIFA|nr:hypothetical protein [Reichenbachiella faecimaris]SMD33916.1 hypothetical protein SAMN04488029_1737 [Reichenbachiella faecimaris]